MRATEVTPWARGRSPGDTWQFAACLYSGCANLLFHPGPVPSPLWASFTSPRK